LRDLKYAISRLKAHKHNAGFANDQAEKNVVVPVIHAPEKVGTEGHEFLFIKYFYLYIWRPFLRRRRTKISDDLFLSVLAF
jgi:hypothetical protein